MNLSRRANFLMRSVGLICLLMIASAWRCGAAEADSAADKDAAALAQRGTDYAARKDFKDALSDLQKAAQLSPKPDYLYALGYVQWQSGHSDLALQSFDKALALKPDHIPALLARARVRSKDDHARAKADLDAADRIARPDDDMRLDIGMVYDAIGESRAAIRQYDLWLDSRHEEDPRRVVALDARCRALAEANQNLDQGLKDCDEAIRRLRSTDVEGPDSFIHIRPQDNPDLLGSRGFVQLRRGDFDRAIKDYDVAVAGRPKTAEYRFARGLAEIRAGRQDKGRADIAAATAMEPDVAKRFADWGLKP
jgi:tetratricopeptide (TPR) repeat protein